MIKEPPETTGSILDLHSGQIHFLKPNIDKRHVASEFTSYTSAIQTIVLTRVIYRAETIKANWLGVIVQLIFIYLQGSGSTLMCLNQRTNKMTSRNPAEPGQYFDCIPHRLPLSV